MAKKDWEQLADSAPIDDLAAMGVSRGRGWKIFSGLLLIAAATFAVAYYVPLHRAHALLRNEYQKSAKQAATFRQQLQDTVATLNQTTEECGKLRAQAAQHNKDLDALAARTERLERTLQAALKKYHGKGRLSLERHREKLRVSLAAPALVAPKGGALTEVGKKAVAALGAALKDSDVLVAIQGLGTDPTDRSGADWLMATTRAGVTAQFLIKNCGLDPARISAAVGAGSEHGDAIALEITPRS